MTNIKVSVIIPVYNTADYLSDALNSIIHQTLREIEIIVINDGSTDESLQIINSLARYENRMRVFSQQNKGQSEARNLGLKQALGEFIYFMDSDDILSEEALFECYEKCKSENLDLVFFDAEIFGTIQAENILNQDYHRTHLIRNGIYSGIEILEQLFQIDGYSASPCLYLVNHSYLKSKELTFYPGIIHEDELFSFLVYIWSERTGFIAESFFKRRIRANSTMTTKFSRSNIDGYYSVILQLDKLNYNISNDDMSSLIEKRLSMIIGGILYNARTMKFVDRLYVLIKFLPRFRRFVRYKDILFAFLPLHRILKSTSM